MSRILTTENGAPVTDDTHSQTLGATGPVLLQDHHLLEKLARFNRERIPERVVHAVGTGAYGTFEVTHPNVAQWTRMNMFAEAGKTTKTFLRFSTVAGSKGAPDTARDPRGFALKFYTEDGNWDLVGNNTPIFFLRDGLKFPDFIHSQKYDPYTNAQEPNNVWDFFSLTPQATHQFVWLFGDRGIPASLAQTDGFGSHTFQWTNASGESFWVKFHFKTNQGIATLTSEQAAEKGADPQYLHKELYQRIEREERPSWTLKVQVMPVAEATTYRFNPFDLTKVWPHADYPLLEIGTLTLTRTPDNYFAETEQSAFDPAHFVPGIGPSPDRMLQARLFAYGDAHRYRLGVNHIQLDVNRPQGVTQRTGNYGRDGTMVAGDNAGRSANYHPNSRGGPTISGHEYAGFSSTGSTGHHAQELHAEDDDFVQAGLLYRVMQPDAQQRLIDNLAGSLSAVTLPGVVQRSVAHFAAADADLGRRLTVAIQALGGDQ